MSINWKWLLWVTVMAAPLALSNEFGNNARKHGQALLQLRKKHQVDPLMADPEIGGAAEGCAEYYAAKGETDDSCPYRRYPKHARPMEKQMGESTAIFDGKLEPEDAINRAVQQWYDQVQIWDFTTADAKVGHQKSECRDFTQLVWKRTRHYGLGVQTAAGKTYVVALYGPTGNIEGEFKENVLPREDR